MIRELTRLSEHLQCVAYCKLPIEQVVEYQERVLSRYGPVSIRSIASPVEAMDFLLPLKTFVRRYLIWPCGEWSFVCCDMIGEWCMVDVYAQSRMAHCDAVAGIALPTSRQFCYISGGVIRRHIACDEDGDRWIFQTEGDPLPFEDITSYSERIKRDRLTPEMIKSLLVAVVGASTPFGIGSIDGGIVGL